MTPVAKGGAILGGGAAVAAGGYGAKFLFEEGETQPITLKEVDDYKENGSKKETFGAKFAEHFLSDEEAHKANNKPHWAKRAKEIADQSEFNLVSGSFLNQVKEKRDDYVGETNHGESKNHKFNNLVEDLINSCKGKYDVTNFSNKADQEKWQEYWKYCSIDGVDRWKDHESK